MYFLKKKKIISNILNLYYLFKNKNIEYIILSGWNNFFYKIVYLFSIILSIKIILRCENNFYNDNLLKKIIKKTLLTIFFKKFYKFIAIGKKNYEMFLNCGVKKKNIILSNYFVDKNFFLSKNLLKKKSNRIKKNLAIKREKVFLFVGKLIKRKGLDVLLEAFKLVNKTQTNLNYKLLIVGSGPEKNNLVKLNNNNNIFFLNFQKSKELLYYYNLADFLIMPSYYETWGLVANEALEMGKPCIVSDKCGCANDLIKNEKNGFVFESGNHTELADIIINILKSKKKIFFSKKSIKKSLKNFDIDKTVKTILELK